MAAPATHQFGCLAPSIFLIVVRENALQQKESALSMTIIYAATNYEYSFDRGYRLTTERMQEIDLFVLIN